MKGTIGNYEVAVCLDESLDSAGEFESQIRRGQGRITIHPDQHGSYLVDTILHEVLHAICKHRGLETEESPVIPHHVVYLLAGDLAEFLVTSGIVKPVEWEARLRKSAQKK